MRKNESLEIDVAANGFIVRRRVRDNEVCSCEHFLVFEAKQAMLDYLDDHFDGADSPKFE